MKTQYTLCLFMLIPLLICSCGKKTNSPSHLTETNSSIIANHPAQTPEKRDLSQVPDPEEDEPDINRGSVEW